MGQLGMNDACGAPGIAPTWTSSAKDAVTRALGRARVWATLGYGIVNEVYWLTTSQPQIRDLGFIIAGEGFGVGIMSCHLHFQFKAGRWCR